MQENISSVESNGKNRYRGLFPATYSRFPLDTLTCGELGSDVHVPIKELTIRRVEHRLEIYSNECQHLAQGAEEARLRQ